VAVANGGGTGNRVMTSSNGINWTSQTSAADNAWNGIAWAPKLGLFAAVSSDGTNRVMTIDYSTKKLVNPKDLVFYASNKKELMRLKTTI
jgi:hypothetical protein